ncbi:hypothetical protein RintRC_1676 [Richelia intracellularis]|nr:hypothetical protein RintRC_3757 [Richelia intracellularis]CDN12382.1 hypothetical protein RintRC_1676 [Richelia intracellularis]
MDGWVSPRLGIRFQLTPQTWEIYCPDGEQFLALHKCGMISLNFQRFINGFKP